MEKLLLLSGASGAGKSSLANVLEEKFQFKRISSSTYLRACAQALSFDSSKLQLQDLGDRLDEKTEFAWIVDDVAVPAIYGSPNQSDWLLDAVRKPQQVQQFRRRFGFNIFHVHLTAPEEVLAQRYKERSKHQDTPYEDVILHSNEIISRALWNIADKVFDTSQLLAEDIARRIVEASRGQA